MKKKWIRRTDVEYSNGKWQYNTQYYLKVCKDLFTCMWTIKQTCSLKFEFCSLDILPLLDILFKAPSFIWCWGLQVLCFHVTHNVCMYVSYSVMEEECRSHKAGWILESLIQIEYICTLPMLCVWKCVNIYIYRYDVCIINLCI